MSKFLRMKEVQQRVPYSRSALHKKIAAGEFPKPCSLGARAVGFLESEINDWIAQRLKENGREA